MLWFGVVCRMRMECVERNGLTVFSVPCAYDRLRQTTAFVNVRNGHFTMDSRGSVDIKCIKTEK